MRLGAICLELENRLSQEVEYLAAEINITDNPFGGKVDFKERFRPGDADIRDFFGRNVGVSGNGLGNIVLKAHFYGQYPPVLNSSFCPFDDVIIIPRF